MADLPQQAVNMEVTAERGRVTLHLATAGAPTMPISVDPQAAFELGEQLARAAHQARFGEPLKSDQSYLLEQIQKRVSEDMRTFLAQRLAVMLTSLRENKAWSNDRLALELVDTILTKVA